MYVLQQNNFTLNQAIDSYFVSDADCFTIHGEHFLVLTSIDGSVLYKWETGKLAEIRCLTDNIPNDILYFSINMRKFMSFSDPDSQQVLIYEWNKFGFGKMVQKIAKKSPSGCSTFTINNATYIACGSSVRTNAIILKWSRSQFQPFQDLPSKYVTGRPHSFGDDGTLSLYLAFANSRTFSKLGNESHIYRWNGSKFVHHQSIPTHSAMDWSYFTISDGQVFLVVANYYAASGA